MNSLDTLKQARDDFEATLCDPEGRVCITGSAGDREITQKALDNLSTAIAELENAEPVARVDAISHNALEDAKALRLAGVAMHNAELTGAAASSPRPG